MSLVSIGKFLSIPDNNVFEYFFLVISFKARPTLKGKFDLRAATPVTYVNYVAGVDVS